MLVNKEPGKTRIYKTMRLGNRYPEAFAGAIHLADHVLSIVPKWRVSEKSN